MVFTLATKTRFFISSIKKRFKFLDKFQVVSQTNLAKKYLRCNFYSNTLVYRIDVQYEINVQVGKFLKNFKRSGQNRRVGGKLSGKSINVQGENLGKISGKSIIAA